MTYPDGRNLVARKWANPRFVLAALVVLGLGAGIGMAFRPVAIPDKAAGSGSLASRMALAHGRLSPLDQRVSALSKSLDLNEQQRGELRKVLEDQRIQMKRIWSATAASEADRMGASQVLADTTGDRIRSLLTDRQRVKYNPAKPARPPSPEGQRTVEDWMTLTSPKRK